MGRYGWESSENLPPGWIYKYWKKKNGDRTHSRIVIMTSEGDMLKSFSLATEYMKEHEKYAEDDVKKIDKIIEDGWGIKRVEMNDDWREEEQLPPGWRMRETRTGKVLLLAPDVKHFAGRKKAIQHMIREGFPS